MIAADMMLRLRAESGDLNRQVDQAKSKVSGFGKDSQNIGKQVTGSIAKMSAAFAAAAGAIEFTKKVLNSTQNSGDEFAKVQEGLKIGTDAFAASLANLDFTNMIEGFLKGYKAGKAYSEQLDDIEDKQKSLGIIEAQTALDIAKQERILKDETSSVVEKEAASLKIRELSLKQLQLQQQVATQRVKAEEDLIRSLRNGKDLTEDEKNLVTDYVKNYIFLTDDQKSSITNLGKAYAAMQKARGAVGAFDEESRVKKTTAAYNKLLNEADDISKKYGSVADVLNKFGDEQRKRWQDAYVLGLKVEEQYVTQETLVDRLDKKTVKLSEKEQKVLEDKIKAQKEYLYWKSQSPIAKLDTSGAAIPSVAPILDTTILAETSQNTANLMSSPLITAATLTEEAWAAATLGIQDLLSNTGISTMEVFEAMKGSLIDAMQAVSSGLSQGAEDFQSFGKNVLSVLKKVISGLLAEAVATMILSAFKTASKSGPLALFVAPALAALGAGIASTAFNTLIPEFAEGGLAYGPTLGLIGEYPGAISNPEVITPLDKLQSLLGNVGGFGSKEVRFVIEQNQLVGILSDYNQKNIYF